MFELRAHTTWTHTNNAGRIDKDVDGPSTTLATPINHLAWAVPPTMTPGQLCAAPTPHPMRLHR